MRTTTFNGTHNSYMIEEQSFPQPRTQLGTRLFISQLMMDPDRIQIITDRPAGIY